MHRTGVQTACGRTRGLSRSDREDEARGCCRCHRAWPRQAGGSSGREPERKLRRFPLEGCHAWWRTGSRCSKPRHPPGQDPRRGLPRDRRWPHHPVYRPERAREALGVEKGEERWHSPARHRRAAWPASAGSPPPSLPLTAFHTASRPPSSPIEAFRHPETRRPFPGFCDGKTRRFVAPCSRSREARDGAPPRRHDPPSSEGKVKGNVAFAGADGGW